MLGQLTVQLKRMVVVLIDTQRAVLLVFDNRVHVATPPILIDVTGKKGATGVPLTFRARQPHAGRVHANPDVVQGGQVTFVVALSICSHACV